MDALAKNPTLTMYAEYDEVERGYVGRDPRSMSENELNECGHFKKRWVSIMRDKCLDCCGGQQIEVKRCVAVSCALWPYRTNKNPFAGREMTEEQRAAAAARLAKARDARPGDDEGEEE